MARIFHKLMPSEAIGPRSFWRTRKQIAGIYIVSRLLTSIFVKAACSGGTQNVECARIEHLAMGVNDFETCPRCGGTGVDPDPNEVAQGWPAGGGLAESLLAPSTAMNRRSCRS
jgi:hypothetical protein